MILLFIALIAVTTNFGDKLSKQKIVNSLELKLLSPSTEIELYNNESVKKLVYTPNTTTNFGLDLNLKGFSIGASFKDPNPENIDTEESQYSDYKIKTVVNNALLEVFYLKYSGFKIGEDERDELLDITARSYGINYTFFIDEDILIARNMGSFAYKKSNTFGTFLTFGYTKNKLDSKNSLVPKNQEEEFKSFVGLRSFDQDALSAIYGIAGTFTYSKFYFQGSLGLGINLSQARYTGTTLTNTSNTGPAGKTAINLGYQFNKALFGLEANLFSVADRQGSTELSLKRSDTTVYYHYFF